MSKSSILEDKQFWRVINYITQVSSPQKCDHICSFLGISQFELENYLAFLDSVNFDFSLTGKMGNKVYSPGENHKKFELQLTHLEWLQLQSFFPQFMEKHYCEELKQTLANYEEKYAETDLHRPSLTLDMIFETYRSETNLALATNEQSREVILSLLNKSILEKFVITVSVHGRLLDLYPRRIMKLDEDLSLIAEDVSDKSLVNILLPHISFVEESSHDYESNFSKFQISEFAQSLKEMDEDWIRIVLKIYSKQDFSLQFSEYHYEKPCLFTNPNGDYIWAATVKPNEQLFEWLCELGPAVEILDPSEFKLQFLNYCEHKLKKLA